MKRFAIFGASGFGREVMPVARAQLLAKEPGPFELVFVDDNPRCREINGHRVLSYEGWLSETAVSRHVCIAVANGAIREEIARRCASDGILPLDIRATNVVQMDDVVIGPGYVLSPFVTITSNIKIGLQFHANIYSYVAHDCVIGDFVTFAPGAKCNGNVVVEDYAYIGTGAVLRQGRPGDPLVIGRGATVGMGAVVTRSVPPKCTVVGNPARPIERR